MLLIMYIQPPTHTKAKDCITSIDKALFLNNDPTSSTVWKLSHISSPESFMPQRVSIMWFTAAALPKEETKTTGEKRGPAMPYTLQVQQPFLYKVLETYRFAVVFRHTCWIITSQPICSLLSAAALKSTFFSHPLKLKHSIFFCTQFNEVCTCLFHCDQKLNLSSPAPASLQ